MLPQFVTSHRSVAGVVSGWCAASPLSQLEERIRARKPDDLSPLDDKTVPLRSRHWRFPVNDPLARADRVGGHAEAFRRRRRTSSRPWRACVHAATWRAAKAPTPRSLPAREIGCASVRATHTVNQLLRLARAPRPAPACAHPRAPRHGRDHHGSRARQCRGRWKEVRPGYDGPAPRSPGVQLHGNATFARRDGVRNLRINAIHYTPSSPGRPGVITARLLPDPFGQVLVLQVEDTRPRRARGRARAHLRALLPRARQRRGRHWPGPVDKLEIAPAPATVACSPRAKAWICGGLVQRVLCPFRRATRRAAPERVGHQPPLQGVSALPASAG